VDQLLQLSEEFMGKLPRNQTFVIERIADLFGKNGG